MLFALYHLGWKCSDGVAIFDGTLHEARLHHAAVVGNGIIERERIDRRNERLIADAHPWQRRVAPVEPFAPLVLLGPADDGCGMSHDRNLHACAIDTRPVDAPHEFDGVVVIKLVDDIAHADIRAHLHGPSEGDGAIASGAPVAVFHVAAIDMPDAIAGRDPESGVAHSVLKRCHHGSGLEHGAWLEEVAHGMALYLPERSVLAFL